MSIIYKNKNRSIRRAQTSAEAAGLALSTIQPIPAMEKNPLKFLGPQVAVEYFRSLVFETRYLLLTCYQ